MLNTKQNGTRLTNNIGCISSMKALLIIFLSVFTNAFGQDFSVLQKDFSWEKIEKKNDLLIEKFISELPNDYELYSENDTATYYTISQLKNLLHIIDFNNDGKDDVIFDGNLGGESNSIVIYENNGTHFIQVFDVSQEIWSLHFKNNKLKEIVIHDRGCCAEIVCRIKKYYIVYEKEEIIFLLTESQQYIRPIVFPSTYWSEIKKITILNDNYSLRFEPIIDDTSETYKLNEIEKGNCIGKIPKGSRAIALSEKTDNEGRVWYFVALLPEVELIETLYYDMNSDPRSYKYGWVSSRFVIIE
jgi:predicted nuclease of restriction endonuclease-like (RecB) superfamily